MSKNFVNLLGNLGKNAEVKSFDSGKRVITFTVATTEVYGRGEEKKEDVQWHNCEYWSNSKVDELLEKGKRVDVTGKIKYQTTGEDDARKTYSKIVVDNLILL